MSASHPDRKICARGARGAVRAVTFWRHCEQIVASVAPAIDAIARHLVSRGYLDGDEVTRSAATAMRGQTGRIDSALGHRTLTLRSSIAGEERRGHRASADEIREGRGSVRTCIVQTRPALRGWCLHSVPSPYGDTNRNQRTSEPPRLPAAPT